MAVDPQNPDIVYSGTHSGYIMKSFNGGESWRGINFGLPGETVNCIAVNPEDPDILFTGTDAGLFKSANGGASWERVKRGIVDSYGNHREYYVVTIDVSNPQVVYVGTEWGCIFKDHRWGETWDIVFGLGVDRTLFINIDPENSSILYAAVSYYGIYKSTDGGETWIRKVSGLPNDGYFWCYGLFIDHHKPGNLYILTSGYGLCIYKSVDYGENWQPVFDNLTEISWIFSLAEDPHSVDTFLCSNRDWSAEK